MHQFLPKSTNLLCSCERQNKKFSPDGMAMNRGQEESIQIETESLKLDHILASLYGISTIFHKIGEMAELQRIMVERFAFFSHLCFSCKTQKQKIKD